jgi:hypothetical protein
MQRRNWLQRQEAASNHPLIDLCDGQSAACVASHRRFGHLPAALGVIHSAATLAVAMQQHHLYDGRNHTMSRISRAVRNHRDTARTRREVSRAIERAATPGVREELMAMAQVQGLPLR